MQNIFANLKQLSSFEANREKVMQSLQGNHTASGQRRSVAPFFVIIHKKLKMKQCSVGNKS